MQAKIALASILMLSAAPASAAVFTNTYAIQASNFAQVAGGSGGTPPFASVNGQFTVTFDTTVNSSGVLLTDLGLPAPYGTALRYTYQSGIDRLNISQTPSGDINDGPFPGGGVYFSIQGASTATPSLRNIINGVFLVTNVAFDAQFNTSKGSVRIVPSSTPSVPEPATWAMMLVGFGMVGASARHGRRKTAVSFA